MGGNLVFPFADLARQVVQVVKAVPKAAQKLCHSLRNGVNGLDCFPDDFAFAFALSKNRTSAVRYPDFASSPLTCANYDAAGLKSFTAASSNRTSTRSGA
jgi:hypothetical protein